VDVILLAERLRVEERLLIDAFAETGCTARLVTPEEIAAQVTFSVNGASSPAGGAQLDPVVSRLPVDRESVALLGLLAEAGHTVTNSPGLDGMLASRDQLLRWLKQSGLETVPMTIAYGMDSIMAAATNAGWPVDLLPLAGSEAGITVEDAESAEAVIEHRMVLGGERVLIVRSSVPPAETRRLHLVGDVPFVTTCGEDGSWGPTDPELPDIKLAGRLAEVLGPATCVIEYTGGERPRIIDIAPLGDFREFHAAGFDIAGSIARLVARSGAVHV
jgi:[lysine-biosynthesis-protein LysW]---L-2-aminoadipate ligase